MTACSILSWKIPWAEEPGRIQSMRLQKSPGTTEHMMVGAGFEMGRIAGYEIRVVRGTSEQFTL